MPVPANGQAAKISGLCGAERVGAGRTQAEQEQAGQSDAADDLREHLGLKRLRPGVTGVEIDSQQASVDSADHHVISPPAALATRSTVEWGRNVSARSRVNRSSTTKL